MTTEVRDKVALSRSFAPTFHCRTSVKTKIEKQKYKIKKKFLPFLYLYIRVLQRTSVKNIIWQVEKQKYAFTFLFVVASKQPTTTKPSLK